MCDLTLAIRLHAAVFSVIAGTPVIAINYLPKVEGFMNGIDAGQNLIQIDNITAERLLNLTKEVIEKRKEIKNQIIDKIRRKGNLVVQYGDLASSVL